MTRTRLFVLPLIAAVAGLAGSAAHASIWTTYPGASCTSDGTVTHTNNGSLLNIYPSSSGYTTFVCPVPRNFLATGSPTSTYVYINFQAANGSADFFCKLRSVDFLGEVFDSASLTVPSAVNVSNVKKVWGGELQVSGPSFDNGYSVVLRCQVPNSLGTWGGIISYRARH